MVSEKYKNPLKLSITLRCIFFVIVLGAIITFVDFEAFQKSLTQRNKIYLSDILKFVEKNIDKDDLSECSRTRTKSARYYQLEQMINTIVNSYNVDNMYIIKPLNISDKDNALCIINKITIDTTSDDKAKLYALGDIFHSTFSPELMRDLIWFSEHPNGVEFHQDSKLSEYGFFYTGFIPLEDSAGNVFALLCADLSLESIDKAITDHIKLVLILIGVCGFLFCFSFITWGQAYIADPIELLEKSVSAFAKISQNHANPSELIYNQPDIQTNNEVESLSHAVTQMTTNIKSYAENLVAAEHKMTNLKENVSKLNVLAHQDSLTHVKNKTAYDKYVELLNAKIKGETAKFAIVMIDLNHLKFINDTYGHEHGNDYITGSCSIICDIYQHSPVFRIGGDEFAVILERRDFSIRDELYKNLTDVFSSNSHKNENEPWLNFSAAAGMASYNPETDKSAEDVFKSADKIMYENKMKMHGGRE